MAESDLVGYLESRDVPCPACGYNLRDLRSSRCPECGAGLELGVHLAEPRTGVLLAGAIGLSVGLGFCGLLGAMAMAAIASRSSPGPPIGEMLPLWIGAVLNGVALAFWVAKRGAIRRAPTTTVQWLVIGSWALGCAFPLWFAVRVL